MNYIVIDLEFNQNFDFKEGSRAPSNPLMPLEIIQIGAVKLNKNMEIVDKFGTMVAPRLYRKLNPFVARVTGLSNRILRMSPPFHVAYRGLQRFIGRSPNTVLCFWGNDDIKELFRNALFYKLNAEGMPKKYINVQRMASVYLEAPASQQMALRTVVETLEIEAHMPFHNAVDDALYTAHVFTRIFKVNGVDEVPIHFDLEKLKARNAEIVIKAEEAARAEAEAEEAARAEL